MIARAAARLRLARRAGVLAAALMTAMALAGPAPLRAQAGPAVPPLVTTEWLQREVARPDLVILQLGPDSSFAKAHVPGALRLDFEREVAAPAVAGGLRLELPTPEAFAALLAAKGVGDATRVVIVFDQPNAFTRAGRAFFTFEWGGLAGRVAVLDGGLPKWVREGRAVASGAGRRGPMPAAAAPASTAAPVAARVEARRKATQADVLAMLGHEGMRVVDARDTVFYQDLQPNNMPRGGHVAGAVSLPYSAVTAPDGTMRSREELEALVRAAGIGATDAAVTYCHIGQQASWVYLALRVLGRDVRVYDGSFDEWSRDAALPVEGARPRP